MSGIWRLQRLSRWMCMIGPARTRRALVSGQRAGVGRRAESRGREGESGSLSIPIERQFVYAYAFHSYQLHSTFSRAPCTSHCKQALYADRRYRTGLGLTTAGLAISPWFHRAAMAFTDCCLSGVAVSVVMVVVEETTDPGLGLTMGNERPEDDRENPSGRGVSPNDFLPPPPPLVSADPPAAGAAGARDEESPCGLVGNAGLVLVPVPRASLEGKNVGVGLGMMGFCSCPPPSTRTVSRVGFLS